MLKYYNRLSQLPSHLAVSKELFVTNAFPLQVQWSPATISPLIVRCIAAYRKLDLAKPPYRSSPLVHPCPPWLNLADIFLADFPVTSPKLAPLQQIHNAFVSLRLEKFCGYTEIYTDGSHKPGPPPSSTAAIAVQAGDFFSTKCWKLAGSCSIFVSELFAILQALIYASRHCTASSGLVIYTDSLSSVLLLQNHLSKSYVPLCYAIHTCISNLLSLFPVKIQYIPSHKNIRGNEAADAAAVGAHTTGAVSLLSPVASEDLRRDLGTTLWNRWTNRYHEHVMNTGKGIAFFTCKPKAVYWAWAHHKNRRLETAITRLRLGHVGLNAHLFKISRSLTNLCSCGQTETIDHFLLDCPLYTAARHQLMHELLFLDVPLTRQNVLGGGDYSEAKQLMILNHLASFLSSTGKLAIL